MLLSGSKHFTNRRDCNKGNKPIKENSIREMVGNSCVFEEAHTVEQGKIQLSTVLKLNKSSAFPFITISTEVNTMFVGSETVY